MTGSPVVANQPVLLSVVFDYKNAEVRIYEDGELTGTNASWLTPGLTDDTDGAAVIVGSANSNKGFDGDIYSVAMYRRVMSDSQRWKVEAALAAEFGLSVVQE